MNSWIPVNEKMPVERDSMFAKFKGTEKWKPAMFEKISAKVLVTVEYNNGTRITDTSYTVDGKWKLEYRIMNARVVAWKEFPKPYEDEKNDSMQG